MSAFALCLAIAAAADPHVEANPLFARLRTEGIASGAASVRLVAPQMADGLSASAQQKALEDLPGRRLRVADLAQKSIVAPFLYVLKDEPIGETGNLLRVIDVAFIAHGELEKTASREFAVQLFRERKDEGAEMPESALEKRGIALDDAKRDRYGHGSSVLLDRVKIEATTRTFVSRSGDSILVAGQIDPRFTKDAEFPNQWRPATDKGGDELTFGEPSLYEGAAFYTKITRLAEPPGALFVESHIAFVEPKAWFGGSALLRSKLPILLQSEVRGFRRRLDATK